MSVFWKSLSDEQLGQEIKRLEACVSHILGQSELKAGYQQTLDKYRRELDLRKKLSQ